MKLTTEVLVPCGLASLLALAALQPALAQEPASAGDLLADPPFLKELPPLEDTQPPPSDAAPASATPPPASSAATAPPASDPAVETELAAPLQPLSTFDATPPAEVTVTAGADETPAQVRYTVEVKGLDEVGLERRFRDLSALWENRNKPAAAAQVQLRADQDTQLIARLLRSEGYYDGAASFALDPPEGRTERLAVTLTATPGPRYNLGQVTVTGPPPEPLRMARDALGLRTGQPIVAAVVEGAEANVSLRLPEQGYPFVAVGMRDILLNEADRTGDYTLPVDAGPRSVFGGFRVDGKTVFGAGHIAVLSRFKPGQLYDSRRVEDLRQALVATSLFSTVALEPVRTGQPAPGGAEVVDVLVRQTAGPPRSLAATAGYGTGEGVQVTASWTHRNLFPPEGALVLTAVAGTQQQRLAATFRRSNAGQRDRTLETGVDVSHEKRDAFDARTFNLSARLSRASTPIWQKRWTYSVGAELVATDESRVLAGDTERTRATYFIAALPGQLGFDASDSLLNPTRGIRVTARLSPEASLQNGFAGYGRSLLETSGYFPVSSSIVLAARARVGSIFGVARDRVAPSRRLYSGGGGSVRGYGYQELGPQDANGDPLGGRSLVEFAGEVRYRFGNFGVVPFLDAGQAYEGMTPKLSGIRYGAGIGARYYTNFGPMRIDVATPIGRKPGEARVALYISIGQAF